LQIIWADGGYAGALVEWVKGLRPYGKLHLDIVRRSDDALLGFDFALQSIPSRGVFGDAMQV
jgi:hypothetical protein